MRKRLSRKERRNRVLSPAPTICTCIRGRDVREIAIPDPMCLNTRHRQL